MPESLTADALRFTPPRLPLEVLAPFLAEHWGVEGTFKPLSGERDQNFRVRTDAGEQYVYKISSPREDAALLDLQIKALLRIEKVDTGLPVPRILRSKSGNACETLNFDGEAHAVRLLSYVPGTPLEHFEPPVVDTIGQIGALQGRLCRALSGYEHPSATHFMPWDILNGLVVSTALRTSCLRDGLTRSCAPFLERLEYQSLPRMRNLPHQVIHNDAHGGNVMVDPEDPGRVTGVIDFGDLVYRPVVVDLSTSLASILDRSTRPERDAAALVHGFRKHFQLPQTQLQLLYDAVVARSILTVGLLQFRADHTETDSYLREVDLPRCKAGLKRILGIDEHAFLEAVLDPERALNGTV